jgi:monovalent cation:H+ antiporter, CPA1 family
LDNHSVVSINILMVLLMVASAVGLAVRWIRVPYPIALVVVGLFTGTFNLLPRVEMTPQLILTICLPALLFEASWNLNLKELLQCWRATIFLSTFGVVASMFMCAWLVSTVTRLDFYQSLLFGAMISATDPISVVAIFRKSNADHRLVTLLESESLFNDGTAYVLFNMVLAAMVAHTVPTVAQSVGQFLLVVVGGIVIGLAVGFLGSRVIKYFDDHLLETTLTMIVAYGSFLLADHLNVSPVLAVVSAGIVVGNYGSHTAMLEKTRISVDAFWEYAAFLVNSIVFLLIGLQMNVELLLRYAYLISVGVAAVLLTRACLIYFSGPLLNSKKLSIPLNWRHIVFIGGMRGALSMALVLSLPRSIPDREALVVLTFGAVLFTLLVPGLVFEPIMKTLLKKEAIV